MKTQVNRRKLKNLLTKNDAQLRLALNNLIFIIAVMLVLIAFLLSPIYYDMQLSDQLWTQYVSANLLWRLLQRIGLVFLLIAVFAAVYQVVFTHRICGPLINFGNTYESIIQGNLTRYVRLRRQDFLKPEAVQVNRMLDTFRSCIAELKENQKILSSTTTELQTGEILDAQKARIFQETLEKNEACLNFWHLND